MCNLMSAIFYQFFELNNILIFYNEAEIIIINSAFLNNTIQDKQTLFIILNQAIKYSRMTPFIV